MKLPKRVTICEVGTRDGFQIEPEFVPTDQKIEVVNQLSATGMPRIEVTSFVSPKAVPALKDAEAVMAGITRRPGTVYAALGLGVLSKFLEPHIGAVLTKILVLVLIIAFIQKRPQGLFALKGRAVEA